MKRSKKQDWTTRFLKVLADCGVVRLAAHAAGISRQAAYQRREKDEAFAAEWDRCLEDALDLLEAEAYRRAKSSSDQLLIFLLRHGRPAKYTERVKQEVSGPNGGSIDFRVIADTLDGKLALIAARIGANGVPERANG